jgi:50S ribosomal protein L16 3-hydroxylase
MTLDQPCDLLGGLSPQTFMRRHWQRKPLLIRNAIADFVAPLSLAGIKKLARRDDVQSRLIWREDAQWQMEHGPFARLPKAGEPGWTLLVQSVDMHDDAAAELMQRFRFIPDARLDDVMISIATDGGGVGPHFDSYDVFLLQAVGQRRWRIGRQKDLSLEPDLPLKVLSRFEPEEEYVLNPGDMLYLPPQVAHDGIAIGDCMTISIGFRAPTEAALARGMLDAAADQVMALAGQPCGIYGEPPLPGAKLDRLYRDPAQPAVSQPAALPENLVEAALAAVNKVRFTEALAERYLGCWLTEPGQTTYFDEGADDLDLAATWPSNATLALDRRTRMIYRGKQLFINGEVVSCGALPALRALADERRLACTDHRVATLGVAAREILTEWLQAGWLHVLR